MVTNKAKRILLVRNPAFFDFGGGERFPVNLATELKKHHYHPVVIARSSAVLQFAALHHIDTVRGWWWQQQNWSGKRALLFPAYTLWQLILFGWYLQLIVRLQPSAVHLQSKDDFIAGTFAARLLGKRVIWTDHADLKYIFANHTIWYKNPVGKFVYLASRYAHKITLVSLSEKKLITTALGHAPDSKFIVIYNGVHDERIEPVEAPGSDTVFCSTSRLVTTKGIGELLTAFQAVHRQYPKTRLWLVGAGPERQSFETKAADDTSITFFGHADEPLRYVAAADIFVHPSYHEGFSLSLIEAAMLGKPILACAVGGNPEIIKNESNGILVPEKDTSALQHAMVRLLNDNALREQLGHAARISFTTEFNFAHIVKESFLPLYETA